MFVPAGASFSASFAVSATASAFTSHVATEQPSAASWITSSRPIPLPPPVTTASRPSNFSTQSPFVGRDPTGDPRGNPGDELHAVEQVRLLRRELLLGDHALATELVELLDLLGDRRAGILRRHGVAPAAVDPVRVGLHLPVDLV